MHGVEPCHDGEHAFKKVPAPFPKPSAPAFVFSVCATALEKDMKKFSYVLAALATIAVGVPTIASAAEFGVRIGGDRDYYRDRDYGPRVGFYGHDRGWHRGWYNHDYDRDRVVIRHHHWDD
jgi:hypothetical protein